MSDERYGALRKRLADWLDTEPAGPLDLEACALLQDAFDELAATRKRLRKAEEALCKIRDLSPIPISLARDYFAAHPEPVEEE